MTVLVPQWARLSFEDIVGVTLRFEPVHANRAARWASFQSCVPSSWRIERVVLVLFGVMRSDMDVVEVTRW